jgi:hypothetical protein
MQAAGLERFLTCKLQHYRNQTAGAAPTSLALWLLEGLLAKKHASSRLQMNARAAASQGIPSGQPRTPVAASSDLAASPPCGGDKAQRGAEAEGEEMTVKKLLQEYKAHLPYHAVEQILRDSCCREELILVSRLYGNWQALFDLLLPGARPEGHPHQPQLIAFWTTSDNQVPIGKVPIGKVP